MPEQVNYFSKTRIAGTELTDPAPNQLLHTVRIAAQHLVLAPLPPLARGEGQGDVEDAEGDPKGREDAEKAELDRDSFGTVAAMTASASGGGQILVVHPGTTRDCDYYVIIGETRDMIWTAAGSMAWPSACPQAQRSLQGYIGISGLVYLKLFHMI